MLARVTISYVLMTTYDRGTRRRRRDHARDARFDTRSPSEHRADKSLADRPVVSFILSGCGRGVGGFRQRGASSRDQQTLITLAPTLRWHDHDRHTRGLLES